MREATTLGVIGAGGIGLQIVTAFHLFEYAEALALIVVMLAIVCVFDALAKYVRGRLIA